MLTVKLRNVWGFLATEQEDSLGNTPVTGSKNDRSDINSLLKWIMEITMTKIIQKGKQATTNSQSLV